MRICRRNCTSQPTSVASISSGRSLPRKSPETRAKLTEWVSASCCPVSCIERNVQIWTFLPTIYGTYFAILPFLSVSPDWVKAQGLNHRTALVVFLQVSVVSHSPYYSPPDSLSQWIWTTRWVNLLHSRVQRNFQAGCTMLKVGRVSNARSKTLI